MTAETSKRHFRRLERRGTDLPATVELGVKTARVRLHDLGLGGAGVDCDLCPALGAAVTLAVEAQSLWDPLLLRGEVAWSAPTRFGVRFVDMNADAAGAVLDLVAPDDFE
ncbi:MAG: PilZ domain-containing protein [Polyangiaceae bacterium]|nr:PilZ domain-containing protein [Polyangiaceae bacterium]